MPFFKVGLERSEDSLPLFVAIIVEAEDEMDAYERAVGYMPCAPGMSADGHQRIVEVDDHTSEQCPVFFNAYFEMAIADIENRVERENLVRAALKKMK